MSIEIVPEWGGNVYVDTDDTEELMTLQVTGGDRSRAFVGLTAVEARAVADALTVAADHLDPTPEVNG